MRPRRELFRDAADPIGRLREIFGEQNVDGASPRAKTIIAVAKKTFGDSDKAFRWLTRSTTALGGVAPVTLLETDEGAREVEDLLGRIGHGLAV